MAAEYNLFVPGRLCLAGEHSDWAAEYRLQSPTIAEGAALVVNLQQGLRATASAHSSTVTFSSSLADQIALPLSRLRAHAQSSSPWRFAIAAAYLMHTRFTHVFGLTLSITSASLPAAKGFSSSAAICVLVVRAFARAYALPLSVHAEMDLAYAAERLTGSACGRLDQVVAAGPGAVVSLRFDGDAADVTLLPTPRAPISVVVADLCKTKDTVQILSSLHRAYPDSEDPSCVRLRTTLGHENLKRIEDMRTAIAMGDACALGKLMTAAQLAFDTAATSFCPDQLDAPALHAALADPQFEALSFGGKGVGSQGDGAVQWVARSASAAVELAALASSKLGGAAHVVTLGASDIRLASSIISTRTREPIAYDMVRTAVIPVAGLGTRLFPASRAVRPKAFFPVVDTDGRAKPVLLHLAELAAHSGLERIVIVSAPDTAAAVRALFTPVSATLRKALKPDMRDYAHEMDALAKLVEVAIQHEPLGFGHAVACGAPNEKPFVLLLGDVVFRSGHDAPSCVTQALEAFRSDGGVTGVVGVTKAPVAEAGAYGVVDAEPGVVVPIQRVVEKPDTELAQNLARDGMCDVVLGPYVFTPMLMRQLEDDVRADRRDRGEIQLTSAMECVLEMEGLRAVRLDGEALDTGNPVEYVRTIARLAE